MAKKKWNSLAFWIKCVDVLGILILISPWLVSVYMLPHFLEFMRMVKGWQVLRSILSH